MSIKKSALIILLTSGSLAAHAEGGCPDGMYPQQGQGWQTCLPLNDYQEPTPPAYSQEVWLDNWGAIAETEEGYLLGASTYRPREHLAVLDAISDCKLKGGKGCKTYVAYKNQCIAIAAGEDGTVGEYGLTDDAAIEKSLKKCVKSKIKNCRTYYSACSYPQRIR